MKVVGELRNASANVRRAITASLDLKRAKKAGDPAEVEARLQFEKLAVAALAPSEFYPYQVGLTVAYEAELQTAKS